MLNTIEAEIRELLLLGKITFVLATTLLIASWLAVGLRLWVRFRITKSPGRDDVAMVSTLVLFTVYCSLILSLLYREKSGKGFGPEHAKETLIYVQASEVFYVLTTTLLKISLGLFFLRVLTKRWQKILFHVIMVVSSVFGFFYVFVSIFQCGNPARFAGSVVGSQKCLPTAVGLGVGYAYGIVNVLADWIFVLVPIVVLVDSKMDRRSKISVSVVMGLGAIGSIASIFRMVYLEGLKLSGPGLSTTSVKATIWATAEPGIGIIAASIAIMRPLLRKIASDTRQKASAYHSRKTSLPRSIRKMDNTDTESVIALTNVGSKDTSQTSWYVPHEEDVWSPTVTVGEAYVQTVTAVKMDNGKPLSVPPPQ